MFLQKENKVTVTQHVKDIETLSEAQKKQLQRALDYEDQAAAASTGLQSRRQQIQ